MNPYAVLGISSDASAKEVKAAYRRMAMRWHPDRNKDSDKSKAEAKFKEISAAYGILSDPKRRLEYDQPKPKRSQPRARPAASRPSSRPRPPTGLQRGADIKITLTVPLYKAIHGGSVQVSMQEGLHEQHLEEPSGGEVCAQCHGRGMLSARSLCPRCAGRGYLRHRDRVSARLHAAQQTTVFLPKSVADGSVLKLREMGKAGKGGGPAGDLLVKIKIEAPLGWKIKGADLFCTMLVPREFLRHGGDIDILLPSGFTERVTLEPGTGELKLIGRGLYDSETRMQGDVYIKLKHQ